MSSTLETCTSDYGVKHTLQQRSIRCARTSDIGSIAGEYAPSFEQIGNLEELSVKAKEKGLDNLQALLAAETALQKLDLTAAAQWVNALQNTEYKTLRLALWNHDQSIEASVRVFQYKV